MTIKKNTQKTQKIKINKDVQMVEEIDLSKTIN